MFLYKDGVTIEVLFPGDADAYLQNGYVIVDDPKEETKRKPVSKGKGDPVEDEKVVSNGA